MVTFDDFAKLEIRIGTIITAEKVPEGDKLLRFILDFGKEKRQIMTALAQYFPDPQVLVGKQIPVLINLQPRTFKGYESQGMIIAGDEDEKPFFIIPEEKVANGSIVR